MIACPKEEGTDAFEHLKRPDYYNFKLVYLQVLGNKTCLGKYVTKRTYFQVPLYFSYTAWNNRYGMMFVGFLEPMLRA